METSETSYGRPNPQAAPQLSLFDFLIGAWRGQAKLRREDGSLETFAAAWEAHYILDGYAIADDYRMTTLAGDLLVLGLNIRAYDVERQCWSMKWLNALGGAWVDLGPEDLGGVHVDADGIRYQMREPVAGHAFTRAAYTNISANHFTWRGERSDDGTTWEEFLVIELNRVVDVP